MDEQTQNQTGDAQLQEPTDSTTGTPIDGSAFAPAPPTQTPAASSQGAAQTDLVAESDTSPGGGSMSIGLLIAALVAIALLLMVIFGAGNSGGGPDGGTGGGDNIIALPTPEPNNPTAIVTASSGANVRTGPGTEYDIVGVLPQGTQAQIVGRSEDAAWWVLNVPPAPNNQGWVSVDLINARNADTVPIIYPPGTERPPSPVISFSADQMALAPGTCTTLQWQVENVAEVYVYPGGEPWQNYPVAGTGSQEVCPETTTIYEMRVVLTDGSVDTRGIRIEVTDAPTEDPLNGTGWRLETLFVNQLLLPGSTIDISFSTGSVAGNSGCNQYSGAYTVNGASLVFGPFVTTRRACTPDVDQQEQFYLQTLATTASFQSDGSQLVLYDAGGQEIARYRTTRDQ